jgi:predicted alpha/beta-hydrolase family hydrolase
MRHRFLESFSSKAAERGIATLRFQFPFIEEGKKRPDAPAVAHASIRAAVVEATRLAPDLPLFAGGKSFGGRMTSQAQAAAPLPGVTGLVFVGFPLHPAGRPSTERAKHLCDVKVPMLFLQGTRDALCDLSQLRAAVDGLGPLSTVHLLEGADHAFHVPAQSRHTDEEIRRQMIDVLDGWMRSIP